MVAASLNARFRNSARPSGMMADAGIIVHAFDATEDPEHPWRPPTLSRSACRATPGCNPLLIDRSSASLIYTTNAALFTGGGAAGRSGLIMRPEAICLLCSCERRRPLPYRCHTRCLHTLPASAYCVLCPLPCPLPYPLCLLAAYL